MLDGDDRIRALGLPVVPADEAVALRAECIRVARRLRHSGGRIIGLLPAAQDVAIPPLGVYLGLALGEVTGATVAFVDANVRWPAVVMAGAPPERGAFNTVWLRDSMALLSPPRPSAAGAGVPQLRALLGEGAELFGHVLVDLTGFGRLGEHLAAVDLCDGVVVVARSGEVRMDQLRAITDELPARSRLGVLLIGSDAAETR